MDGQIFQITRITSSLDVVIATLQLNALTGILQNVVLNPKTILKCNILLAGCQ